uniref:Uncharacterized protein n=1 Tax=Ixodes ricinus TaxID=34613 RepID=A0A6B0UGM9_IXORI
MPVTVRTPSKKMSNLFSWGWMVASVSGLPSSSSSKFRMMFLSLRNTDLEAVNASILALMSSGCLCRTTVYRPVVTSWAAEPRAGYSCSKSAKTVARLLHCRSSRCC